MSNEAFVPASPGTNRQAKNMKSLNERIAGGVDRCCIPERLPRPGFNLWVAELSGSLIPFGRITVVATQNQVANTVGVVPTARQDVIEFKGRFSTATVDAPMPKLFQQIAPDLPAKQLPSLVLDAGEFGILDQGLVELDSFNLNPTERNPSTIPLRPGEDIANTRTQGRRQPPTRADPVGKARRAVPQVGTSASATIHCSLLHGMMYWLPAMGEVSKM